MEMPADTRLSVYNGDEFFGHFHRFDGSEADARKAGDVQKGFDECGKCRAVVQIAAVVSEMNSRQYNFAISFFSQFRRFPYGIFRSARFETPARVGNDAKRAIIVAAFLHFDESARRFLAFGRDGHVFEFFDLHDVDDM